MCSTAYAVPVTVEVFWPSWSSDNRVTLRNPSNATLDTICDPFQCFNSTANTPHLETRYYDLPAGNNYSVFLEDSFGDGWNGTGPYVRVFVDGVQVINDSGPPNGGSQTLSFNVSSNGGDICGASDKLNNWVSGSFTYSESDIGGTGIDMTTNVTGGTAQISTIVGGTFGVSGLDLRTNGFTGAPATFTYDFSLALTSIEFNIGHINSNGTAGDRFTITARDTLGNTVFPSFTTIGSSYTTNAGTGVINATGATPTNIGVSFSDPDLINQLIIVWDDCSTCGNSFHGTAISDVYACRSTAADIDITKDDGSLTYTPGGTGAYVITVSNNGPDAVSGVVIEDNLPNGVTLSGTWSCSASVGSSCSAAIGGSVGGSNVSLNADILNNGTITVTVPVNFSNDMGDY